MEDQLNAIDTEKEYILSRVLILGVLREFTEKLFMLLFAWGKTAEIAVFPQKELTHILHEVSCAKGFKVNTPYPELTVVLI